MLVLPLGEYDYVGYYVTQHIYWICGTSNLFLVIQVPWWVLFGGWCEGICDLHVCIFCCALTLPYVLRLHSLPLLLRIALWGISGSFNILWVFYYPSASLIIQISYLHPQWSFDCWDFFYYLCWWVSLAWGSDGSREVGEMLCCDGSFLCVFLPLCVFGKWCTFEGLNQNSVWFGTIIL